MRSCVWLRMKPRGRRSSVVASPVRSRSEIDGFFLSSRAMSLEAASSVADPTRPRRRALCGGDADESHRRAVSSSITCRANSRRDGRHALQSARASRRAPSRAGAYRRPPWSRGPSWRRGSIELAAVVRGLFGATAFHLHDLLDHLGGDLEVGAAADEAPTGAPREAETPHFRQIEIERSAACSRMTASASLVAAFAPSACSGPSPRRAGRSVMTLWPFSSARRKIAVRAMPCTSAGTRVMRARPRASSGWSPRPSRRARGTRGGS